MDVQLPDLIPKGPLVEAEQTTFHSVPHMPPLNSARPVSRHGFPNSPVAEPRAAEEPPSSYIVILTFLLLGRRHPVVHPCAGALAIQQLVETLLEPKEKQRKDMTCRIQ